MATISTRAGTFTVPDRVASDYAEQGVVELEQPVDESWTVAALRARARQAGVTYKGLSKADLLQALQ